MKKLIIGIIAAIIVLGGGLAVYIGSNAGKHKAGTSEAGATDSSGALGATDGAASGNQATQGDGVSSDSSHGSQNSNPAAGGTDSQGAGGQNATSPNPTTSSNLETATQIAISNFAFSPKTVTVKVGTSVTWTNKDGTQHNVDVIDRADGPSSQMLSKGDSYTYTFKKAGTYNYTCTPHPYMKGTVVVTE